MKPQQYRRIAWVKAHHDAPQGRIRSEWETRDGIFHWEITVPPGSTATIHVPTTDAASVRENGQPATTSPGVKFLRHTDGRALYKIPSGHYRFTARL
jgi:alpha-L-rhamnosidase